MDQAARHGDDVAFLRLDREFNDLCLVAVRNPYAVKSLQLMQPLSRRFWFLHYQSASDLEESAAAHAAVARAIAANDEPAAMQADDGLMDHIEQVTRSTVE
jgi:DNA-binding GntR family transcriptional regulator